ncbi:alpha-L-fucosidase [Paenibacillus allorhizosphaerae]|uniref:Alpha-L-fucosidase n=1 Tax=Paenibacillus allorhizosphaerae TaxID=2849866 RepID=A0ABM8VA43_9BACL|nr:alpha-L-fucosidase [Paenibacillus allorhizosphaerae]CAG7615462.1 hypothetical protein PAECIP111802_00170 [Paenibacillus allorhizosphaerae]
METRRSVDWFKEAKWGVFCHYLPKPPKDAAAGSTLSAGQWNERVDRFDVEGLASQLDSVGAKYFYLTLGQNTGHYCAPNETYDSIVGIEPSKCSKRDLVNDLADALAVKGIRLLVYLPSGAPDRDPIAMEKLEWENGYIPGTGNRHNRQRTGKRLAEFQRRWEAVIAEWSLRWGNKVNGWWIDGCYFADEMYRFPDAPNFESFAAAMRAGNPDSIVAFNPGVIVPVISHRTEHEDYIGGEVIRSFPVGQQERWLEGRQYHILSFLGSDWGQGEPSLPDEFVIGYTKHVNDSEGVVTWDVPISHDGLIEQPFMEQLKALHAGLSSAAVR